MTVAEELQNLMYGWYGEGAEEQKIEAEQNKLRVKELRKKIERQAEQITRLEVSRKDLKVENKKLRLKIIYGTTLRKVWGEKR